MSNQTLRTVTLFDENNNATRLLVGVFVPPNPSFPAMVGGEYEFHYDPATYVDPRQADKREFLEELGR